MPTGKPIQLGPAWFPTKKAASATITHILHHTAHDTPLTGRDGAIIAALYQRHVECDPSRTVHCVGINVLNGISSDGFYAVRPADWPGNDRHCWSWYNGLTPGRKTDDVNVAMRNATIDGQWEFKLRHFNGASLMPCQHVRCQTRPQGPEMLTVLQAQVHHLPPKFRKIASVYKGLFGVPVVKSVLIGTEFVDPDVKRRWLAFHDNAAQRIVVCRDCNAFDERRS